MSVHSKTYKNLWNSQTAEAIIKDVCVIIFPTMSRSGYIKPSVNKVGLLRIKNKYEVNLGSTKTGLHFLVQF